MQKGADTLLIRLDTDNKILLKRSHSIGQNLDRMEQIPNHERLEDVQFELPGHSTNSRSNMITHHL